MTSLSKILDPKYNTWPSALSIDFSKGMILTAFFIFEGFVLWRVLYPQLLILENLTLLQRDLAYLFLNVFNIFIVLWGVVKYGKIDLEKIISFKKPTKSMSVKWVYIAIGMSMFNLIIKFPFGLGAQFPDFILRHLVILFVSAILIPIIEEIFFRGILFGSIRTKFGRLYAFLFSILCFIFAHSTIQGLIWQGNLPHFFYFLVPMITIAFLLSYIYETTQSLLLCIIFHSISNGVYHLAPLMGFLYGGYVITVP